MTYTRAVEDILFSESDYYRIKRGIDFMHKAYAKETGIEAGALTFEEMLETDEGIVVSPVHAAHCLIDIMRTTRFLRGIYQAILDRKENMSPVRILYAGCGPYATLLTPLTSMFSPEEVAFTLLDISEVSLDAVKSLYRKWNLSTYLEDTILANAVTEDLGLEETFDIIVSETMQATLRHECQVPLTRKTLNYLKPNGTFIPQRIVVDARMVGDFEVTMRKSAPTQRLGTIYDLDYRNLPSFNQQTELLVPETKHKSLELFTEIHVYENEVIGPYESGLTLPMAVRMFFDHLPERISFKYLETEKPVWELRYLN